MRGHLVQDGRGRSQIRVGAYRPIGQKWNKNYTPVRSKNKGVEYRGGRAEGWGVDQ